MTQVYLHVVVSLARLLPVTSLHSNLNKGSAVVQGSRGLSQQVFPWDEGLALVILGVQSKVIPECSLGDRN